MDRHEQPGGYYELDFPGRLRLTHYPSGFTCLRHDWMVGRDAGKWVAKLRECADAHPEARWVYGPRGNLVGDLRDMPAFGGGFAVGDTVLTRASGEDDHHLVARDVVAVLGNGDPGYHDADDAAESYLLEDGSAMWFSGGDGGWMARGPDGKSRSRTFRPHPSQDPGTMRETDAALVARVLSNSWAGLEANDAFHLYAIGPRVGEEREEGFRGRYVALGAGIAALAGEATRAGAVEGDLGERAVALVDDFESLVGDVKGSRASVAPSWDHEDARIGAQLQALGALRLGMRRRGLLPDAPEDGDDAGPPGP